MARTLVSQLDCLLDAAAALGTDARAEFSWTTERPRRVCAMLTHGRSGLPYPVGFGKTPAEAARDCVDDLERIAKQGRKAVPRGA